jgi:hypothetical protein
VVAVGIADIVAQDTLAVAADMVVVQMELDHDAVTVVAVAVVAVGIVVFAVGPVVVEEVLFVCIATTPVDHRE